MKTPIILILIALFFGVNNANAQFNKPLQSPNSKVNSSEAQYNIGIVGGLNTTRWFHSGGTKTVYHQPFNFGIIGGLSVERMLNKTTSISLEGYYAMRNLQLNYEVQNFPTQLPSSVDNGNRDFYRQFDIDFKEINVQVLYTYYLSKSNFRPYVFVGPRFSMPLREGTLRWQRKEILKPNQQHSNLPDVDTIVALSAQNMWQWNLGVVAGAGIMYKLNVGNYYFLIKADVSAHASLAYFTFLKESPFVHASLLNSFTYEEQQGTSQNVIGAGYIDPYLLGMRFNTDAAVKITLMFPLKKQLQGACIRWGEYD